MVLPPMKQEWRDEAGKLHVKVTCPLCFRFVDTMFDTEVVEESKLIVIEKVEKSYRFHLRSNHPGEYLN